MNNTEDRYEEYEEYTRKKYIILIVIAGLILIGLAIPGYKMLIKAVRDSNEENDRIIGGARKTLTEGLEQYYELTEGMYTVTDRAGERSGYPVYEFKLNGAAEGEPEYTAAIGTKSLCTDFCLAAYYDAAGKRAIALAESANVFPEDVTLRLAEIRTTFLGHRGTYDKRCTSELLPVWINWNEIARFEDGKVEDRDRWFDEVFTSIDISIDTPLDIKLTEQDFSAIRDELALFTEELRIRIRQSEGGRAYKVYVYNPRKDIVTTDSYLAPEE